MNRKQFFAELVRSHKFFVKRSKYFVGTLKEDKSKPLVPTFGYMQDWQTKPFNTKNKVWTIDGFEYQKTLKYSFKDLLYYPIAYIKFMWWEIKQ